VSQNANCDKLHRSGVNPPEPSIGIVVGAIVVVGWATVVVGWATVVVGSLGPDGGLGFEFSGVHAMSSPSSPTTSKSPAVVRPAQCPWAGRSDELVDLSNAMTPAPFGEVDARLHHRFEERVRDLGW
jgi:hypothetical protein